MQVAELLQEETFNQYVRRLVKKEGMVRLGRGAYAQVFQHPEFSNVAVKVYRDYDAAYKKYLRWCMKNQGNKYVPRIISHQTIDTKSWGKGDNGKIGIVFMKKMRKAKRAEVTDLAKHATALMYSADPEMYDNARTMLQSLKSHSNFELFSEEHWDELTDAARKRDPDLAAFAAFMSNSRYGGGDVHNGNIMVDERGNLVFTDPLAA